MNLRKILLCPSPESLEIFKELIIKGIDVNRSYENKETLLWTACDANNVGAVKLLIKAGANVNKCNQNGISPLANASYKNYTKIVDLLLKADANIEDDLVEQSSSPLLLAASQNHPLIVKKLIKAGADLDVTNEDSMTPLMLACDNENIVMVNLLLRAGANVNDTPVNKKSPMHYACSKGNIEIIKALLKAGADVNAYENPVEDVEDMFDYTKGEVEDLEDLYDEVPNHPFQTICEKNNIEIMKLFITAGIHINMKFMENEDRALHIACRNNFWSMISLLIAHGAKCKVFNDYGDYPFDYLQEDQKIQFKREYVYYRRRAALLLSYQPLEIPNIFSILRNKHYDCWRYTLTFL